MGRQPHAHYQPRGYREKASGGRAGLGKGGRRPGIASLRIHHTPNVGRLQPELPRSPDIDWWEDGAGVRWLTFFFFFFKKIIIKFLIFGVVVVACIWGRRAISLHLLNIRYARSGNTRLSQGRRAGGVRLEAAAGAAGLLGCVSRFPLFESSSLGESARAQS